MTTLNMIRGRQVIASLTNQSGGAIIAGDVVIVSTANDESFTTTTSAAYNSTRVGVALESIAAAAAGRVLLEGYAPLVNVSASATRGYYLLTHTVAKQATSQSAYVAGAFGQILKAGTAPSAMIFPVAQSGALGAGLVSTVSFVIDGGGSAITTGVKGDLVIDFACTLNSWTLLADASGAIKIDVWRDVYGSFPPTDADSITNAHEPEIAASGVSAQDTSLGDWTSTAIVAGDVLRFNVDSAATITRCLLSFKVTRT